MSFPSSFRKGFYKAHHVHTALAQEEAAVKYRRRKKPSARYRLERGFTFSVKFVLLGTWLILVLVGLYYILPTTKGLARNGTHPTADEI